MLDVTTIDREYLDQLSVEQLRDLAHQLTEQSQRASREIQLRHKGSSPRGGLLTQHKSRHLLAGSFILETCHVRYPLYL